MNRLADLFRVIRSAVRVSAAVESGHAPVATDLRRLGIRPEDFGSIGHG